MTVLLFLRIKVKLDFHASVPINSQSCGILKVCHPERSAVEPKDLRSIDSAKIPPLAALGLNDSFLFLRIKLE